MYISEIAPAKHRGRLAGMFQFNIVFGILIAYVSNALLAGIGANAWRWMLGVAAFPSLLYAVFCFGLPRAHVGCSAERATRGRYGSSAAHRTRGLEGRDRAEADEIIAASSRKLRRTFLDDASSQTDHARHPDCFFNQLSGINRFCISHSYIRTHRLGAKAPCCNRSVLALPILFSLLWVSG